MWNDDRMDADADDADYDNADNDDDNDDDDLSCTQDTKPWKADCLRAVVRL